MAPAIGLSLVVTYLTHQYMPRVTKEGDKWDQMFHGLGHMLMTPAMSLLIGWVVKQWV